MATALETPDQPGAPPGRVIHVLLAKTEQPLVATFDRYVDELIAVRAGVDALLTMHDRAELLYLCQTPEVLPEARDRAHASGQQRLANWRGAVARMLKASGRPVPWPLADPGGAVGPASSSSHGTASGGPEADRSPRRPGGT